MDLKNAAVIVHFDATGEFSYHACGDVRFFIVDERVPRDRVFEWLRRDEPADLAKIIGDSHIGSSQDERHPALKAVIEEAVFGVPRLSLLDRDPVD